ncbi:gamma-glutamylcyclotransferase [Alphaproteobacteria bacterium]|nr:gamma-glutamylcyclotransferase [Alphaproteobacteria bacterium]
MVRIWPMARAWYRIWGLKLCGQPHDDVWYFAYGANMNDRAFRKRRRMQPSEVRGGRIRGYRLRFNLEGRPKGRAAPANIAADPDAEVWGVLYRITKRELVRLNASEGIPGWRYRPIEIQAEDNDGIAMAVVAYIAEGNVEDGDPSLRYIKLLREGAREHGLPDHWLAHLDGVRHAE